MAYTLTEQRALQWYADQYDATPQLSSWPIMYFKQRTTGAIIQKDLGHIVTQYKQYMKGRN